MSRDKLEMASRALTEFTRTLRSTSDFADDFVWDFSAFEGWIEAPELHGREAFDEQMDRWTEPFESWTMEISQMLDAGGDDVLGVGVQRGVMTGGGTIEMP